MLRRPLWSTRSARSERHRRHVHGHTVLRHRRAVLGHPERGHGGKSRCVTRTSPCKAIGVRTAAEGVKGYYPAFDITPPHLFRRGERLGIFSPYDLHRLLTDWHNRTSTTLWCEEEYDENTITELRQENRGPLLQAFHEDCFPDTSGNMSWLSARGRPHAQ